MRELLIDWNRFLQTSGATFGLVLAVSGVCLLMMGWRFDRLSLIVLCGAAGVAAGERFLSEYWGPELACGAGAVAAALLGMLLRKFAAPVLAGLTGAMTLWAIMGNSTVPAPTIYIVLALAFFLIGAPALSSPRNTIIILTSFVGGAFVVSGLAAMALESRWIGPHFKSMTSYEVFYPFLLAVPTISGIFVQLGAVRRKDCGDVSF